MYLHTWWGWSKIAPTLQRYRFSSNINNKISWCITTVIRTGPCDWAELWYCLTAHQWLSLQSNLYWIFSIMPQKINLCKFIAQCVIGEPWKSLKFLLDFTNLNRDEYTSLLYDSAIIKIHPANLWWINKHG